MCSVFAFFMADTHFVPDCVVAQLIAFAPSVTLTGRMDGWMNCDFTSFSTVFQSYQDDGRLIMKECVQWSSVYG